MFGSSIYQDSDESWRTSGKKSVSKVNDLTVQLITLQNEDGSETTESAIDSFSIDHIDANSFLNHVREKECRLYPTFSEDIASSILPRTKS